MQKPPMRPNRPEKCTREATGSAKLLLATMLVVGVVSLPAPTASLRRDAPKLQPTMLLWRVGLDDRQGPTTLIESITPATWHGHGVWRVTHYSQDSSECGYIDSYDLDPRSLAPLHSISRSEGMSLELTFFEHIVEIRVTDAKSTVEERATVSSELMAEGPGLTPFVATLPLRQGYVLNRYIVDRWEGHGDGRVKKTTLRVVRQTVVHSALGDVEAMELSIRPQDESFDIREFVLARGLHWPVNMTYVRGNSKLRSEVTAIAVASEQR